MEFHGDHYLFLIIIWHSMLFMTCMVLMRNSKNLIICMILMYNSLNFIVFVIITKNLKFSKDFCDFR